MTATGIDDEGSFAQRTLMRKHSIVIAGHRTSVSLEDAFWTALRAIAGRRGVPLARLVAEIDAARGQANLSSAIRVFVLAQAQAQRPGESAASSPP